MLFICARKPPKASPLRSYPRHVASLAYPSSPPADQTFARINWSGLSVPSRDFEVVACSEGQRRSSDFAGIGEMVRPWQGNRVGVLHGHKAALCSTFSRKLGGQHGTTPGDDDRSGRIISRRSGNDRTEGCKPEAAYLAILRVEASQTAPIMIRHSKRSTGEGGVQDDPTL
jgi:hypothetical protein